MPSCPYKGDINVICYEYDYTIKSKNIKYGYDWVTLEPENWTIFISLYLPLCKVSIFFLNNAEQFYSNAMQNVPQYQFYKNKMNDQEYLKRIRYF